MIDVVSDASVVLKWFHEDGEEELDASRAMLDLFGRRAISLSVLDLIRYEVGNALIRGRAKVTASQAATVLDALDEICPRISPSGPEMRMAAALAEQHRLTLCDATYASVARARGALLATMDEALLDSGLGLRPSQVLTRIASEGPALA